MRSSLVATVTGSRVDLARIAAPKSLQPCDTLVRVSGMMEDSVTLRSLETRSSAGCRSILETISSKQCKSQGVSQHDVYLLIVMLVYVI